MFDPHPLLDGPVRNALITGDHHETLGADDFQPLVVQALPGYRRQVGMAGESTLRELGERLVQGKVVLLDEERGRHRRLCSQRTQLLLVGDRGRYLLGGHVVATGDLLD